MKVCVQVKLMSECSGSVDDVKRVKLILDDHEEPEGPGLSCAADTQTGTGTTGGLTLSRFLQPKSGIQGFCCCCCLHNLKLSSSNCRSGVIDRWELLRAQKAERQTDVQQWQKLNSDLCDVTSWLGRMLPELERLQSFTPATSIRDFKVNVGKLKVWDREFKITRV